LEIATSEPQRRYKNLEVGYHVSGSFREYCPNPNPNIYQRIRTWLFGNIVCAIDRKRYKGAWDDGTTSDSKEATFASLPPNVQPPLAQDRLNLPKKQWTMRQRPLPKMKGILNKRNTCQKLEGGIRFIRL
jgi:hypothetical protein